VRYGASRISTNWFMYDIGGAGGTGSGLGSGGAAGRFATAEIRAIPFSMLRTR
jgi:hypothetical protein